MKLPVNTAGILEEYSKNYKRRVMMNTTKKMEWMGLPLYVWVVLVAITVAGLASGKMPEN